MQLEEKTRESATLLEEVLGLTDQLRAFREAAEQGRQGFLARMTGFGDALLALWPP